MSDFCAGIVTYQPDILRLKENLAGITCQVKRVYIVDNHSSDKEILWKLINEYSNVSLIENDHNYGIARALNQMCEQAVKDGFGWILTLDQDTITPQGLIKAFKPYTDIPEIGIICPAVCYDGWNNKINDRTKTEYTYACMTSASLTRTLAWEKVGGFREDYFIDFVDNEFCMKLGINNYKILRVNECQIHHQLGDSGTKKVFGLFRIRYSKHSPLRLYYMARNNYSFIREYGRYLSVFKENLKLGYVLGMGYLFSDDKKKALQYMIQGLKDARVGITGEHQ